MGAHTPGMVPIDSQERARRGAAAEDLAAAYVRLLGYEIVARNVRIGGGEIDLVGRIGDWLVFFEVRFRVRTDFGVPAETVRGRKAYALGRAARAYVARWSEGATCWRVDVVSVQILTGGRVEVSSTRNAVPL